MPPDQLRLRVDNLKSGTYIDDIIYAQDSALYRWPDERTRGREVYLEPSSSAAGWQPAYVEPARSAFAEWNDAGFPLASSSVYDSAGAAITLRWKERFPAEEGQRIGVTERIHTREFWIASARIEIANHDSRTTDPHADGRRYAPARDRPRAGPQSRERRDERDVPESASTAISPSDRATLRLLYLVPPGSLR